MPILFPAFEAMGRLGRVELMGHGLKRLHLDSNEVVMYF